LSMTEDKIKADRSKIIGIVKDKSVLKQDVFQITKDSFRELKSVLEETVSDLKSNFGDYDERVNFDYKDQGDFQAEMKVAGDVLIFFMHTNVFQFEKTHSLWRSSYFKDDPARSYVGVINVYNFLADSFKYHRTQDLGYLIARIFINKDGHFLVQGKRQLGFLFNNILEMELDRSHMADVVNSCILYTLDFDLFTPPYQAMEEVSVTDIESLSQHLTVATGKRLGFKFSHEEDDLL
jgi:hypothetical protein